MLHCCRKLVLPLLLWAIMAPLHKLCVVTERRRRRRVKTTKWTWAPISQLVTAAAEGKEIERKRKRSNCSIKLHCTDFSLSLFLSLSLHCRQCVIVFVSINWPTHTLAWREASVVAKTTHTSLNWNQLTAGRSRKRRRKEKSDHFFYFFITVDSLRPSNGAKTAAVVVESNFAF